MKDESRIKTEMRVLRTKWMGPDAEQGKRATAAFHMWKALNWVVAEGREERPSTNVSKLEK